MGEARLSLADKLEAAGHVEAARDMRDYDAACEALGTTAAYVSREFDFFDEVWPDPEVPPFTRAWLAEKALVAVWKAARQHARCERPPEGWRCTRAANHEGPCAAIPTPTRSEGASNA